MFFLKESVGALIRLNTVCDYNADTVINISMLLASSVQLKNQHAEWSYSDCKYQKADSLAKKKKTQ